MPRLPPAGGVPVPPSDLRDERTDNGAWRVGTSEEQPDRTTPPR